MQFANDFDRRYIIDRIMKKNWMVHCAAEDIGWMLEYAEPAFYRKGSSVYTEGTVPAGFYIIIKGRVEIVKRMESGELMIMAYLSEGNFMGNSELFASAHIAGARCLSDCEIALITRETFFGTIAKNPGIVMEFLKTNSFLVEMLANSMVIESAERKIRNYLKWLIRESGTEEDGHVRIYRRHTHEEIGRMLRLTRETVTKTLSGLKETGLLDITKEYFIIHDAAFIAEARNDPEAHLGFYGSE